MGDGARGRDGGGTRKTRGRGGDARLVGFLVQAWLSHACFSRCRRGRTRQLDSVRCLTTTKKWKFKTRTTKWSTKRRKPEQEARPSVQAQHMLILDCTVNRHKIEKCSPYGTQNMLILDYTRNRHKIGKCSPYGMNQSPQASRNGFKSCFLSKIPLPVPLPTIFQQKK